MANEPTIGSTPACAVCILGMHRSGTSALARVLNLLGVDLGNQPKPTGFDNLRGFWEHVELVGVHQELLETMGTDWDDPRPLPTNWWRMPAVAPFRQRIAEIVRRDFAGSPLWGIKDPRLTRLWILWRAVLEDVGTTPKVVIIARHPHEVEASLFVRNGLPQWQSRLLYLQYLLDAEKETIGTSRVFLTYSQLLGEWRSTIGRIAQALALPQLQDAIPAAAGEIDRFLSTDLRHHRVADDTPPRDPGLAEWAADLYHAIRLANGDGSVIERRCVEIRGAFGPSQALFGPWIEQLRVMAQQRPVSSHWTAVVTDLRDQLQKQQDIVTQQGAQVQELTGELAKRDAVIQNYANSFVALSQKLGSLQTESRDQLQKQQDIVTQQDAQVQELTGELAKRDAVIQRRANNFVGLSRKFHDLRTELRRREADIRRFSATIAHTQSENDVLRSDLADRQSELGHLRQVIAHHEAAWALEQYSVVNPVRRRMGRSLRQFGPVLPLPARKRLERFVRENLNPPLSAVNGGAPLAPVDRELDDRRRRSSQLLVQAVGAAQGKYDVLVFPIIDWEFRIQRPQHLARQLGAMGHRVFYLRTTFAPPSERGYALLKSPVPNVFLCQLACPHPHPRVYCDVMATNHQQALVEAVSNLREDVQCQQLVSIVDHPFWRRLAEALPGHSIVYDCMDHHAGFSTGGAELISEENALLQNADLVITSSAKLFDKVAAGTPAALIRNGAEVSFFAKRPKRLYARSNRPVVGYYGAIAEWFDMEMVTIAARVYPEMDFVLVGSTAGCDISAAKTCPNITLVGEVPYMDLPSYLHAFDVCIIPFKINDLTLHTNPVKIYEYLSAGKPVVATRLPELELIREQLHLVGSKEKFLAGLKVAMDEAGDKKLQEQRSAWARQHDWSARARQLESSVSGLFPKVSVVLLTHNNRAFTKACLYGLEKFTQYPDWELVIVDNASTDGSVEFLKSYAARQPRVHLILNRQNCGFAAGNNLGLKAATGEHLVLLNNDTFPTIGWLRDLTRHLIKDPTIGLIGPVTNNIGNEARIDIDYKDMAEMAIAARRYTSARARQLLSPQVVAFFCAAMPRAVYEKVGPLDETYGLGFFEDDDYCRRVREAGYRVAIADDVFIHHHLSASFQKLGQEQTSELFQRNLAIYEAKWGKWIPHQYRQATAVEA